jgi:hypothetical protein
MIKIPSYNLGNGHTDPETVSDEVSPYTLKLLENI